MEGKSDRRADTDLKSAGSVMNGMGFESLFIRQIWQSWWKWHTRQIVALVFEGSSPSDYPTNNNNNILEVLFKMSRTIKSVLHYETRINNLQNNGKDNSRIIKKLERQLRAAQKLAEEKSK